ncbi:alpha/beta hydrolase [Nocardioides sp.]|uniref:alpha/beta hydrolase n=1 Tax=Nocardioides sp. TaxID=35761 RepID=UPI002B267487|nr:alpha/beta hydrolase [Nocardioides sp.]
MPSLSHQALAYVVPRLRGTVPLDSPEQERARLEECQATVDRSLPTKGVRRFERRYEVTTTDAPFPVHVIRPRGRRPRSTVYYLHGGGFVAPADPLHTKYALRLAEVLDAEVVMPDYPLAPSHDWRAHHEVLLDDLAERCATQDRVLVAGDSAGGGIALALAQALRDRGGAQPSELLLLSPWVDLTTSTPETYDLDDVDPWLQITKLDVYAGWWAGSPDDLARFEVSPALGDLAHLPRTLMICGSRDLLVPGCRLLADRAAALRSGDWDLTYLEAPDLIHVFPLMPIPEARTAWRYVQEFLR